MQYNTHVTGTDFSDFACVVSDKGATIDTMNTTNTDKIRMVLSVLPEIRGALRIESAKSGTDMSDLVADWVRESFPEAVREYHDREKARKKTRKDG